MADMSQDKVCKEFAASSGGVFSFLDLLETVKTSKASAEKSADLREKAPDEREEEEPRRERHHHHEEESEDEPEEPRSERKHEHRHKSATLLEEELGGQEKAASDAGEDLEEGSSGQQRDMDKWQEPEQEPRGGCMASQTEPSPWGGGPAARGDPPSRTVCGAPQAGGTRETLESRGPHLRPAVHRSR